MTRVFLADSQIQVRSALRLLLSDLTMQVVGEAGDWSTTILTKTNTFWIAISAIKVCSESNQ